MFGLVKQLVKINMLWKYSYILLLKKDQTNILSLTFSTPDTTWCSSHLNHHKKQADFNWQTSFEQYNVSLTEPAWLWSLKLNIMSWNQRRSIVFNLFYFFRNPQDPFLQKRMKTWIILKVSPLWQCKTTS